MIEKIKIAAVIFACLCISAAANARDIKVAAAANFVGSFKDIAQTFETETGHKGPGNKLIIRNTMI